MVTIDIIIVNWNAGSQLFSCLESIATTSRDGFKLNKVIVVDNASSDGSADNLENLNLPLIIKKNKNNRGFGAACNQGAAESKADYLLFLNPDCRLSQNTLAKPIHFMQQAENRKVGICGIQLIDEKGETTRTCARFPTPAKFFSHSIGLDRLFPRFFPGHFMIEWDHKENREVDHVIGAFFLVRRFFFEALGGFDERFFVYLEDLDFSLRIRQAGWQSFYLAEIKAYHKGGGTSDQIKARRLFYSLRSRILYGYKHFGQWSAHGLMVGTLLVEPIARIGFAISKRSFDSVKEIFEAYHMLFSYIFKEFKL